MRVFLMIAMTWVLSASLWSQSATTCLPKKIDTLSSYLFYLHGKILEDQGVNAQSKDYGHYEYQNILDTLTSAKFNVISEIRPKNTDPDTYALKVVRQVDSLLKAKVPPTHISVIGASKGAWIAMQVSSKLKCEQANFVFMGICGNDYDYTAEMFKVCGHILSIYEKSDALGSTCEALKKSGSCVTAYNEIELQMGIGHGFLYRPYKEWVIPAIAWARNKK